MMIYLWALTGLAMLGFLVYRGGRVWRDTGHLQAGARQRLGWALLGAAAPARYWWGAHIQLLSASERQELLTRETRALGLDRADSLRCPLCGAEIAGAWGLTSGGQPAVAAGPVECPSCDFRLDACRHCTHFLPGLPQEWRSSGWGRPDLTAGRCSRYKALQPVEQACTPDMARQLRARGYEQIRAPLPIVDSFLPLDHCRAFAPERTRLQQSGVRWPDARRRALLRLLAVPVARVPQRETHWSSGEEWLF